MILPVLSCRSLSNSRCASSAFLRSYVGASSNWPIASRLKRSSRKQPDLAQPLEIAVGVQPIAVLRPHRWDEQADPVVVVQGAHRDAGQRGDLAYRVKLLGFHEGQRYALTLRQGQGE